MKTKKISKQSLVIAVLSLLLVLSMGLYATGAYFTDKSADEVHTDQLNFGTVKLDATYGDDTSGGKSNKTSYEGYIVPGDAYYFAGQVDPANTVEMFVAVQFTYSLKITGQAVTYTAANGDNPATYSQPAQAAQYDVATLYAGKTGDTSAITVVPASFATGSNSLWEEITGESLTPYGLGTGVRLFKVSANAETISFTCSLVLDPTNCENVVHARASGTDSTIFCLNNTEHENIGANYVIANSIQLQSTVKVAAIQSKSAEQYIAASTVGQQLASLLA